MSYKPVSNGSKQESICAAAAAKPRAVSSPTPPTSLPLSGVAQQPPRQLRSRAHSGRSQPAVRQNAIDYQTEFDESEYCIVHSNAVETTPFYPAAACASAAPDRSSLINGCASGGAVRSSVSSSASTTSSSRGGGGAKSRKSSGGSTATSSSRLRRELRKSALEAAAVAAVATPSSPSANLFTNLKGFFAKWLHESKSSNSAAAVTAASASTGSDLDGASTFGDAFDGASTSAAASDCGGDSASYLNIACPQFPQECSNSDLMHARNVMSMNSSIDSDYLLHYYTSLSPSSACSVSTASTNGDFFLSGSSCRGGIEDCLSDGGCRQQQPQQQQQQQQQQQHFPSQQHQQQQHLQQHFPSQQHQQQQHLQQQQKLQQHQQQQYSVQQHQQLQHHPTVQWDVQVDYDLLQRHNPRQVTNRLRAAPEHQSTLTQQQPTKSKSLQSQTARQQKDLLCSTWPPSGRRLFALEEDDYMLTGVNCFHVIDSVLRNSHGSFEVKEFEFNIPHDDIEFRECILRGRRRKVYKGHWHGEVTIHAYESLDSEERRKFWEEIAKLSLIRHENIFLFMGASMDPPTSRFAVVTCLRKGASLCETIHSRKEKLSASRRLSIIRDLAQAAGYLHAKSIVIRRFNSSNVFLEPRAKLSLQDYSVITEDEEDRPGYLIVPESLVWYTPPEILALLTGKTTFVPDSAFTVATDIFAFSIIMFEVCGGRYPFGKCDRLQYMEHVCRGERDQLHDLRASDAIKSLITDCWSHDPLYRPEFSQINMALNNREATHLRHSSSEPENLHRHAKIGFY